MKLPAIRLNPIGMLVLSACAVFLVFLYASGLYHKRKNDEPINLKHILVYGISAAEMGGSKVREVKLSKDLKLSSKGKTKEGAEELLTAGDLFSHRVMFNGLRKAFPALKVISEEHDSKTINLSEEKPLEPKWSVVKQIADHDVLVSSSDIDVWIDPLDATKEFTENLIKYVTTMVCVSVKGVPVIGIIHQPFKNRTVWAWVNHGTSDNLDVSTKSEKNPVIIVSRSHAGKVEEVAKAAFGPEVVVTLAGGSGYKSLQVAEGKADAYIHVTPIKKWDICAGNALLIAMGGQMTTLDGKAILYNNTDDVENNKGIVATLHDHNTYLEKLVNLKN